VSSLDSRKSPARLLCRNPRFAFSKRRTWSARVVGSAASRPATPETIKCRPSGASLKVTSRPSTESGTVAAAPNVGEPSLNFAHNSEIRLLKVSAMRIAGRLSTRRDAGEAPHRVDRVVLLILPEGGDLVDHLIKRLPRTLFCIGTSEGL